MGSNGSRCENTYRLVAHRHGEAADLFIEFEASDKEAVFIVAGRLFRNEDTEVYSNGRALCRLLLTGEDGYWVINPPRGVRPAHS